MSDTFSDARFLDGVAYDLLEGDASRAYQRSLINRLANGNAPYTEDEVEQNQIRINTSDLSMPRLLHDARSQFSNGFLGQMRYFTATTDSGPIHKRSLYGGIMTKESNRILKGNISYFETQRSSFASLTLHGISPEIWETQERVIPRAIGVEDALIPSGTLLDFENLPFIFVRRSFTGKELQLITQSATRDTGWNIPFVERCLDWLDSQMTQLVNQNWPEIWSPEKWEEQKKQDGGWCASDRCPTIDCFDVYGYVDDGRESGWVRRIILDSWSNPGFDPGGKTSAPERKKNRRDKDNKSIDEPGHDDFLYNSDNRKVADSWQKIMCFQFADLSAVAPFRYHSVRSLGWMLYAVCHLRNRLFCKIQEAGFEALLQMFEVDSMDDIQKALKIEIGPFGFIDKTIRPIKAGDRWQPNAGLIELVAGMTQQVMDSNAKSWTANPTQQQQKQRESNFQRMADLQAVNALVSAGINQAYQYKNFEYVEIFRRLCIKGSRDVNAQLFQARCIAQGVPENLLYCPEKWEIQSERMQGGGNQTLENMISQSLMEALPGFDPPSQRIIRRDFVMGLTKDPAKAMELVPDAPVTYDDATERAGTDATKLLMQVPVQPLEGVSEIEYTGAMLKILAGRVQAGMKQGGMVKPEELQGLQAIAKTIDAHIKIIAKDETQKAVTKQLTDALGKLVNLIKGFAQRLQQAAKAAQAKQQQQNGHDPKDAAKAQSIVMGAALKGKIAEQKNAQKMRHDDMRFKQDLQHEDIKTHAEVASKDLETAASIRRGLFDDDENESEESSQSE